MTTDHQPVAEVSHGRLRWHLPTPDADPAGRFIDNDTHLLYDQAALDAAVAAAIHSSQAAQDDAYVCGRTNERERCTNLCESAADAAWASWNIRADPADQGAALKAEELAAEIRGLT